MSALYPLSVVPASTFVLSVPVVETDTSDVEADLADAIRTGETFEVAGPRAAGAMGMIARAARSTATQSIALVGPMMDLAFIEEDLTEDVTRAAQYGFGGIVIIVEDADCVKPVVQEAFFAKVKELQKLRLIKVVVLRTDT